MAKISNILVVIDPTAAEQPCLAKAVRLAKQCDARLELLACETRDSLNARYAAHLAAGTSEGFVTNLRPLLEAIAEPVRQQGIDVCLEVERGDPLYSVLLQRIKRGSADLLIKDTHHHSLLQRTLLTNTDWQLIRACTVPLLLTRPTPWQAAPRIAAAIDPGHEYDRPAALDEQILYWARWLTGRLGGSLQVLNAFMPLALAAQADGNVGGGGFAADATAIAVSERHSQLETMTARYAVASSDVHVQVGVPSQVLPTLARGLGLDMLAMGAISRSGLQRLFIGSTAERILEQLPCDVLVIKPPDFAAALG